MELHHQKHHQAYVNALNDAEAKYTAASTPKEKIALQAAIKFNGGGQSIFIFCLCNTCYLIPMKRSHQSFSLLEESRS